MKDGICLLGPKDFLRRQLGTFRTRVGDQLSEQVSGCYLGLGEMGHWVSESCAWRVERAGPATWESLVLSLISVRKEGCGVWGRAAFCLFELGTLSVGSEPIPHKLSCFPALLPSLGSSVLTRSPLLSRALGLNLLLVWHTEGSRE